jgi:hypothetical protein
MDCPSIYYILKKIVFGIQNKAEKMGHDKQEEVYRRCQRLIYCLSDVWYDMEINELKEFENKINTMLDNNYKKSKNND